MGADVDVEELEVRLLLEAIHGRYGYDLRGYARRSIHRRVRSVLARSGLPHLGELQHRVLTDPAYFGSVLGELTVRTSEMFRDPSFFLAVRTRVVPLLRTYPLVKIWLSGCAAGEEVYSAAVLLTEEGLYDRVQIYATDLNPEALELAKQGVYSTQHLARYQHNHARSGAPGPLVHHYTEAFGNLAMREGLRRNVLFFQHDLVSDQVFGEMHLIFCRNVLIYFGRELRERVLAKFAASLCPGGFLCLGKAERLGQAGAELAFVEFDPTERIYRHAH
jgi:chemotaxis protein methyltransferase CheR